METEFKNKIEGKICSWDASMMDQSTHGTVQDLYADLPPEKHSDGHEPIGDTTSLQSRREPETLNASQISKKSTGQIIAREHHLIPSCVTNLKHSLSHVTDDLKTTNALPSSSTEQSASTLPAKDHLEKTTIGYKGDTVTTGTGTENTIGYDPDSPTGTILTEESMTFSDSEKSSLNSEFSRSRTSSSSDGSSYSESGRSRTSSSSEPTTDEFDLLETDLFGTDGHPSHSLEDSRSKDSEFSKQRKTSYKRSYGKYSGKTPETKVPLKKIRMVRRTRWNPVEENHSFKKIQLTEEFEPMEVEYCEELENPSFGLNVKPKSDGDKQGSVDELELLSELKPDVSVKDLLCRYYGNKNRFKWINPGLPYPIRKVRRADYLVKDSPNTQHKRLVSNVQVVGNRERLTVPNAELERLREITLQKISACANLKPPKRANKPPLQRDLPLNQDTSASCLSHKENVDPDYDPYEEFENCNRHPRCKFSLEEVKLMADRIPDCMGVRLKVNFIRQIYKHGKDLESWDWTRYENFAPDYIEFLSKPITTAKNVPHPNCKTTKSQLTKLAQCLEYSKSRKGFVFLCFYHGLDPKETLEKMKEKPLVPWIACPEPWRALEANPKPPEVPRVKEGYYTPKRKAHQGLGAQTPAEEIQSDILSSQTPPNDSTNEENCPDNDTPQPSVDSEKLPAPKEEQDAADKTPQQDSENPPARKEEQDAADNTPQQDSKNPPSPKEEQDPADNTSQQQQQQQPASEESKDGNTPIPYLGKPSPIKPLKVDTSPEIAHTSRPEPKSKKKWPSIFQRIKSVMETRYSNYNHGLSEKNGESQSQHFSTNEFHNSEYHGTGNSCPGNHWSNPQAGWPSWNYCHGTSWYPPAGVSPGPGNTYQMQYNSHFNFGGYHDQYFHNTMAQYGGMSSGAWYSNYIDNYDTGNSNGAGNSYAWNTGDYGGSPSNPVVNNPSTCVEMSDVALPPEVPPPSPLLPPLPHDVGLPPEAPPPLPPQPPPPDVCLPSEAPPTPDICRPPEPPPPTDVCLPPEAPPPPDVGLPPEAPPPPPPPTSPPPPLPPLPPPPSESPSTTPPLTPQSTAENSPTLASKSSVQPTSLPLQSLESQQPPEPKLPSACSPPRKSQPVPTPTTSPSHPPGTIPLLPSLQPPLLAQPSPSSQPPSSLKPTSSPNSPRKSCPSLHPQCPPPSPRPPSPSHLQSLISEGQPLLPAPQPTATCKDPRQVETIDFKDNNSNQTVFASQAQSDGVQPSISNECEIAGKDPVSSISQSNAVSNANKTKPRPFTVYIESTRYPLERLSDAQMSSIEDGILEAILEADEDSVKPVFNESFRSNGRYGVICNDESSRNWLFAYLGTHKPWPDSSLRIVSKEFIEIRANAVLPMCNDDNGKILRFIQKQNKGLNVSKWEVVQRWNSEDNKTCLDLIIDEESAQTLQMKSKIIFKMGTGNIVTAKKKIFECGKSPVLSKYDVDDVVKRLKKPGSIDMIDECRIESGDAIVTDQTIPPNQPVVSLRHNSSELPYGHSTAGVKRRGSWREDWLFQNDSSLPPKSPARINTRGVPGDPRLRKHNPPEDFNALSTPSLSQPDQPLQDVATDKFRRLIAAGFSSGEALQIIQGLVSKRLESQPPVDPEPRVTRPPPPSVPKPSLQEIVAVRFNQLVAAGLPRAQAWELSQAFALQQMGRP